MQAHATSCRAVRFAGGNGELLYTASTDQSILAVDVATGAAQARKKDAHDAAINRLAATGPTGLASGGDVQGGCLHGQGGWGPRAALMPASREAGRGQGGSMHLHRQSAPLLHRCCFCRRRRRGGEAVGLEAGGRGCRAGAAQRWVDAAGCCWSLEPQSRAAAGALCCARLPAAAVCLHRGVMLRAPKRSEPSPFGCRLRRRPALLPREALAACTDPSQTTPPPAPPPLADYVADLCYFPEKHCVLSVAGDGTLAVIDLRKNKVGGDGSGVPAHRSMCPAHACNAALHQTWLRQPA